METFKNLVSNLHEKIAVLTDDINFLREDSKSKNNMINLLLTIISKGQNISPNNSNTTNYNDSISGTMKIFLIIIDQQRKVR